MQKFSEKELSEIQRYFSAQLSKEEKGLFEQKVVNDPNFKKEIDWYHTMFVALEEMEDDRLRTLLKQGKQVQNREEGEEQNQKIVRIPNWLKIAASILFLIALAIGLKPFLQVGHKDAKDELFAIDQLDLGHISRDIQRSRDATDSTPESSQTIDAILSEIDSLGTLYAAGNYEAALSILSGMPDSSAILYYRANCLIALERYGEAIGLLKEVETFTNESFSNLAQWPLAKAYYMNGDISSAKSYAEKAKENEGIYDQERAKAAQLLERIIQEQR